MKNFSINEAVNYGWGLFKANKKVLILSTLVFSISNIGQNLEGIFGLALFVVSIWIQIGWYKLLLNLMAGKSVRVKEIFSYGNLFLKYFGTLIILMILIGIPIVIATILSFALLAMKSSVIAFIIVAVAVVLAVYIAIKYQFAPILIIDKEIGIKESFKESARMTEGVKWKLIGLGIVMGLIIILGILALGVGVLVALPVSMLAYLYVYKKLYHDKVA